MKLKRLIPAVVVVLAIVAGAGYFFVSRPVSDGEFRSTPGAEYVDSEDATAASSIQHKIFLKRRLLDVLKTELDKSGDESPERALKIFLPILPDTQFVLCYMAGERQALSGLLSNDVSASAYSLVSIAEAPVPDLAERFAATARFVAPSGEIRLECQGRASADPSLLPLDAMNQVLRPYVDLYSINTAFLPASWAPFYQETPAAPDNVEQAEISAILTREDTCRMFAGDSNSVAEGRVQEGPKTRFVWTSEDVLEKCEIMLKDSGGGCPALELAGSASRLSVGLGHYPRRDIVALGANRASRGVTLYPADEKLMSAIGGCFDRLLVANAPVIFSTNGGAWKYVDKLHGYGFTGYFVGKEEASKVLASKLHRPVISPLGYIFGSGRDTISPAGWYRAVPE
jgi:hypothetical protein